MRIALPLLRSGVLCYTIAKQPEQFRCGGGCVIIPLCWEGSDTTGTGTTPSVAPRQLPQRGSQRRWGATPYRCFAELLRRGADPGRCVCVTLPLRRITEPSRCGTVLTLRLLGCDLLFRAIAIRFLRSSIPSQRVPKLCHATAPLCISLAVLSEALPLLF